jgi:hypothetical protein
MTDQNEGNQTGTSTAVAGQLDVFVMPIQPIKDYRFVENKIVRMLLDTHPNMDMNTIACGDFTDQERMQFAQLIGYSLSGFSELSYVDDETYDAASIKAETGKPDIQVRYEALYNQINEARKGLKVAASALFRIHQDDLEV